MTRSSCSRESGGKGVEGALVGMIDFPEVPRESKTSTSDRLGLRGLALILRHHLGRNVEPHVLVEQGGRPGRVRRGREGIEISADLDWREEEPPGEPPPAENRRECRVAELRLDPAPPARDLGMAR